MRGSCAKALRAEARTLTVGFPDVAYTKKVHPTVGARRGGEKSSVVLSVCTRLVYKQLKVAYKRKLKGEVIDVESRKLT